MDSIVTVLVPLRGDHLAQGADQLNDAKEELDLSDQQADPHDLPQHVCKARAGLTTNRTRHEHSEKNEYQECWEEQTRDDNDYQGFVGTGRVIEIKRELAQEKH